MDTKNGQHLSERESCVFHNMHIDELVSWLQKIVATCFLNTRHRGFEGW